MDHSNPRDCFHHQPLDLTENTFRLLDIHGVSKEGLVECTIEIHNRDEILDRDLEYRALSYAWGPEHPTYFILVNGKSFRVRENLLRFLQAALSSHPTACTRIWIDAICIDQENNAEKMHQVMQMASIYRDARSVFVWLGQSKGDYKELQNAIADIEKSLTQYDLRGMRGVESELCVADHPASHQVQDLLMREYWKRMWIIQEIITAGVKAQLICGEHSFAWYPIRKLVRMHDHRWKEDQTGMAVRVIRMEDRSAFLSHGRTILELLRRLNGGGACADVRDKVYSLLGLLRNPGNLRPDYSVSAECLFFRVCQNTTRSSVDAYISLGDAFILKRSLGLDVIGLDGHLRDAKDEQVNIKDSILLRPNKRFTITSLWNQMLWDGLDWHFDHDQSIGATTWLLTETDVLFEFASFGPQDKFRRAIVLRECGPGLFKYIAMAEYRDNDVLKLEVDDRCWAKGRWFLYHLSALLSADCFTGKDGQISVSSEVFLVLMKLYEMSMSIGDPRADKNDLEFLGIRDRLVITHYTLFMRANLNDTRKARSHDSARDWNVVRLDLPTHEIYYGCSELRR